MSARTYDVSGLPTYAFRHHSLLWWGQLGLIAIKSTAFAIAVAGYFYLSTMVPAWPPGLAPPGLLFGTINVMALLASLFPNQWYKKAAEEHDLRGVRLWLSVALLFACAFLIIRVFEFASLNCRWDSNA